MMIRNRKRLWALLLSAALIVTQLPAVAMAENNTPEDGSIASFKPLPSGVAKQTVDMGTELSELNLPDMVAAEVYHVTEDTITGEDNTENESGEPSTASPSNAGESISGNNAGDSSNQNSGKTVTAVTTSTEEILVTWDSEPAYDGDRLGDYVFTADVGGYTLSGSAKLPQITVTVMADMVENSTEAPPTEPLSCTKTEGCTLTDGHEGECVTKQPPANGPLVKTITGWTFVDDDLLTGNELSIPNVNVGHQADFDTVVSMLPTQISAEIDGETEPATLNITDWSCPEYKQDEKGNWPLTGEYIFTASLPESYDFSLSPTVKVLLGGVQTYSTLITGDGYSFDLDKRLLTISSNAGTSNWRSSVDKAAVKKVVIQEGVTEVRERSFRECANLTEIVLPDTLTEIHQTAFELCNGLVEINFPEALTRIDNLAFDCCYSLERITLPVNLDSIGLRGFGYCNLREITIPANVTSIDKWAFLGNANLKTVVFLGTTAPSFGEDIFLYIPTPPTVYVPEGATGYNSLTPQTMIAPAITGQPQDVTATVGSTAVFTVTVDGVPSPSFQWQVNEGSGWSDVTDGTGGHTAGYTTPAVTEGMNGRQYQCVIINIAGTVATDAATLTVEKKKVSDTAVTGITPPAAGAVPDTNVDVDSSAGYTAEKVVWKNGNEIVSGNFGYDTAYTVCVTLKAKQGYRFADSVIGAINGQTVGVSRTNDAEVVLSSIFDKTGLQSWDVNVENGTGDGNYVKGAVVNITADSAPSGKVFETWTANSTDVIFDNPNSVNTSFIMPEHPVTVTANFKALPPATYTVTVRNGTSDKTAATEGEIVTITAGTAPAGQTFDKWTTADGVTFANESAASTTFIMPAKAVTVTATYKALPPSTYAVTVKNGTSDKTAAAEGETVTITAGTAPAGQTFDKWTTADGVTFANESAASTTFMMPAKAVTVTATYKTSNDGASSGGGDDSSYTEPEPQSIFTFAGDNISQNVSRYDLKKLADSGKSLILRCDKASMTFDPAALKAILAAVPSTAGNITFTAAPADLSAFPDEAKQIGAHPAYDFTISYKDGNGNIVTVPVNFPASSAAITLNYTPAAGEVTGSLFMVYVDGKGAVTWLDKSSYDSGRMMAEVPHFSTYGVACKAPAPVFTDITSHWAKEDIEFVAARGLLSGTGNGLFSPDSTMTRGMFVTALGRLAGINPDSYQIRSFTDVKADAYYAAYVEWAAQKNIVKGTGEGLFSPDAPVTREQMAVMMVNYAGQMGYSIPILLAAATFADNDKISAWAAKEVAAMQRAGIVRGKDGYRFDPQGNATRAEVSAVLRRFVEIVIDPATATGWVKNDSGHWLYYKGGTALTGWQTIGRLRYYFNADGVMHEGWKQDTSTDKWYYWTNAGAATGWREIGGKWYYFDENGVMAVNTKVDGYEIGPDGARKKKQE